MFKELEAALEVVRRKKAALDAAAAQVKQASDDYQDALKTAQELHAQISADIAAILPAAAHTRVA